MKVNVCKVIEAIILIVSILLILWAGISWIEVISKNLEPNPQYSPINLFALLIKGGN